MPILDDLVDAGPHALHSLDPQGGVDLAEVKRRVGDRVALIGNVNCALLDSGTDEEVVADVRRALRDGMPGGGYFSRRATASILAWRCRATSSCSTCGGARAIIPPSRPRWAAEIPLPIQAEEMRR